MKSRKMIITVAICAAAPALILSACGSSGNKSTSSAATSTPATQTSATTASTPSSSGAGIASAAAVAADPTGQLKFTKSSLTVKAGKVTIAFTNTSSVAHNLTIQQGTNGATVAATPTFQGSAKTLTVNLKAGTYTFFCSVPGHRQAGMQGTLTVH